VILDYLMDRTSPWHWAAAVLVFIGMLLGFCAARAEVDGDKFNKDMLYCQSFGQWGHDIALFNNHGVSEKAIFMDMLAKLSDEVRDDTITPEDAAIVTMMAHRFISDSKFKGYGPNQLELDFYNNCMEFRGHKPKETAPKAQEYRL